MRAQKASSIVVIAPSSPLLGKKREMISRCALLTAMLMRRVGLYTSKGDSHTKECKEWYEGRCAGGSFHLTVAFWNTYVNSVVLKWPPAFITSFNLHRPLLSATSLFRTHSKYHNTNMSEHPSSDPSANDYPASSSPQVSTDGSPHSDVSQEEPRESDKVQQSDQSTPCGLSRQSNHPTDSVSANSTQQVSTDGSRADGAHIGLLGMLNAVGSGVSKMAGNTASGVTR